jgi:hypothetical protein
MSLHSDRPSATPREQSSPLPVTGSKRPASPTSPNASKKARPEAINRLSATVVPASGGAQGSASPARRQVIEVLNTPRISSPAPQPSAIHNEKESRDSQADEEVATEKQSTEDAVIAGGAEDIDMQEATEPEKESERLDGPSSGDDKKDGTEAVDSETAIVDAPPAEIEENATDKDVEMQNEPAPAFASKPTAPSERVEEGEKEVGASGAAAAPEKLAEKEENAETGDVEKGDEKEAGEIQEPSS